MINRTENNSLSKGKKTKKRKTSNGRLILEPINDVRPREMFTDLLIKRAMNLPSIGQYEIKKFNLPHVTNVKIR